LDGIRRKGGIWKKLGILHFIKVLWEEGWKGLDTWTETGRFGRHGFGLKGSLGGLEGLRNFFPIYRGF